jgi:hypothetical protein
VAETLLRSRFIAGSSAAGTGTVETYPTFVAAKLCFGEFFYRGFIEKGLTRIAPLIQGTTA